MELSVIILNYNVRYFLEQCLLSVQKALENIDSEIVVIDNNSEDGSCEMALDKFPTVKLLQNKENVGFSKANNQAVKIATGKYLCILNPDTVVAENTFLECIEVFKTKTKIGGIGVQMIDGTGKFLPESKRNIPTPKKSLKKIVGLTKNKNGYYANNLEKDACGNVEVLAGAFIFMERKLYEEVNGFDEDYFMYGEDIDLCYKILKAGFSNYYLGSQQLLHYKGESTIRDKAYYERFFGAMRIFYSKHFNTNKITDLSVDVAVSMAKKLRKVKNSKTKVEVAKAETAIFISDNENLFKKISAVVKIPMKMRSEASIVEKNYNNCLVIFDSEYISFENIFSTMDAFKNQQNSFRIIPPNCNFLIGSNRSDEKGEVLHFLTT